ncbi:MAG: D-Ala-D-Ala carboxypeptidase family metallohydrolase [Cyanobacteria bacterium P01_F01_bin.143]
MKRFLTAVFTFFVSICLMVAFSSGVYAQGLDGNQLLANLTVTIQGDDGAITLDDIKATLERIELRLIEIEGDAPEPEEVPTPGNVAETISSASDLAQVIDGWPGLPNFSGSEITRLTTKRCGTISNSIPPSNLWNNIAPTLAVLQRLRTELGAPIYLTSVYRNPEYNACIGGAQFSQHLQFKAVDFTSTTGNSEQWRNILNSYRGQTFTNPADGSTFVLRGGLGLYNTFVHLDTRDNIANWDRR